MDWAFPRKSIFVFWSKLSIAPCIMEDEVIVRGRGTLFSTQLSMSSLASEQSILSSSSYLMHNPSLLRIWINYFDQHLSWMACEILMCNGTFFLQLCTRLKTIWNMVSHFLITFSDLLRWGNKLLKNISHNSHCHTED